MNSKWIVTKTAYILKITLAENRFMSPIATHNIECLLLNILFYFLALFLINEFHIH